MITCPTHLFSSFLDVTQQRRFSSFCFNSCRAALSPSQKLRRALFLSTAFAVWFRLSPEKSGPVSPSERQLGSLIESCGFASLRYAACWGDEIIQGYRSRSRSLSLSLVRFALESRETASKGKQSVALATGITCRQQQSSPHSALKTWNKNYGGKKKSEKVSDYNFYARF